MSEIATPAGCRCTEDPWMYLDAGVTIQAVESGSTFTTPEKGWVRWEERGAGCLPWHMWVGEGHLFCDGCGTRLNADGTTTERVDAVTMPASSHGVYGMGGDKPIILTLVSQLATCAMYREFFDIHKAAAIWEDIKQRIEDAGGGGLVATPFGYEGPMVPAVTPEAVRGTRFFADTYMLTHPEEYMFPCCAITLEKNEADIIYAVLRQSHGLAVAQKIIEHFFEFGSDGDCPAVFFAEVEGQQWPCPQGCPTVADMERDCPENACAEGCWLKWAIASVPAPAPVEEGRSDKYDLLIAKAREVIQDFVDKCDRGEARSVRTYAACKGWLDDLSGRSEPHTTNLGEDAPTPDGCTCAPGGGLCAM